MERSKIFQIVGYQNSGKTTLIEKMIRYGTNIGFRIGTVKHHGHGGTPLKKIQLKDSDRHRMAGAKVTAVEGGGELHIEFEKTSWKLEEILLIYKSLPLDLILVEGYKNEPYPKVLIIRDEKDLFLMNQLENIVAIITWIPLIGIHDYMVFLMRDCDVFIETFFQVIRSSIFE